MQPRELYEYPSLGRALADSANATIVLRSASRIVILVMLISCVLRPVMASTEETEKPD
jgi:hypothetical protein